MPAAAIAGVASIGGSLLSASAAKSAANKAARAQTAANDAAIGEQRRQYDLTRSDLSPWMSSGNAAQQQINALLGIGGSAGGVNWSQYLAQNPDVAAAYNSGSVDKSRFTTPEDYAQWHYQTYGQNEGRDVSGITSAPVSATDAQSAAIANLKNSPLYQSLFSNGENTILANAAATGGLRGGNTQSSLANFGRDTLSAVIQNQLQNLTGVSGAGENAAAQTGTFGANSANNISGLLSSSGTTQANAALAGGQATTGAINSIVGTIGGLAGNKDVTSWAGKLF